MQVQSYNRELVLANAQFKRLFNNISIVKGDSIINFKCILENRSRVFKALENPERNSMYSLPLVTIQRTGITKNNERLVNINNEVKYRTHSSRLNYNLFTPVPVDINYQVTFISKYQEHIDKAISNLMPFFNKDLYVRCEHPKYEGLSFTNQIIMDDTITEEAPSEFDASQDDIRTCTMNFTLKTCLFCDNKRAEMKRPTYKQYLSSYISSVVTPINKSTWSSMSAELPIYLSDYMDGGLSCMRDQKIDVYVDIPISGESEPGTFSPEINKIYMGFYPVPTLSNFENHMTWVDQLDHTTYDISGIISCDEQGLDTFGTVDSYHYYDPHKDMFIIDIK